MEAIWLKDKYEGKVLRLILSLTSSYEHMKLILMYGKEILKCADVTWKLLSEEKRPESSSHASSEGKVMVCKIRKKKSWRISVYWKSGQYRHVKSNFLSGEDSEKGPDRGKNVFVVTNGDDFLWSYVIRMTFSCYHEKGCSYVSGFMIYTWPLDFHKCKTCGQVDVNGWWTLLYAKWGVAP